MRSVTAHIYKVTLIQYTVGVLLTVCNLIPTKLDYLPLPEKTYAINFNYKLCDKCKTHTDAVRNPGVLLDPKFFLPSPWELYISSLLKLWDSYVSLTYSFSTTDYYRYTTPFLDPCQYIPHLLGITL